MNYTVYATTQAGVEIKEHTTDLYTARLTALALIACEGAAGATIETEDSAWYVDSTGRITNSKG